MLGLVGLGRSEHFQPSSSRRYRRQLSQATLLPNTNVSAFWPWIDRLLSPTRTLAELVASGTPYCADLERICNGSATGFPSVRASKIPYSLLMDVEKHWDVIRSVVKCDANYAGPFYPLAADDAAAAADAAALG